MKAHLNLIGQKFGKLTVLSQGKIILRKTQKSRTYYWKCRCECGTEKEISTQKLRKGQASCGCYKSTKLPAGEGFLNKLFGNYRRSASNRNLSFSLSKQQFETLVRSKCHYCGELPKYPGRGYENLNGTVPVNGIDRIKNRQGYTLDNSVSCCSMCNRAKSGLPYKNFCAWLDNITRFRASNAVDSGNADVLQE